MTSHLIWLNLFWEKYVLFHNQFKSLIFLYDLENTGISYVVIFVVDVQQLCGSCPHLKELDLSDSTLLTCASVEYIAGMLRGLEYIALSRCYHIAPAALP